MNKIQQSLDKSSLDKFFTALKIEKRKIWIQNYSDKSYYLYCPSTDTIRETEGTGESRALTVTHQNGYKFIRTLSTNHQSKGIGFISGLPSEHPLKADYVGSHIVVGESDLDSFEDQYQKVFDLQELGLNPSAIVHSGKKSLHIYFTIDEQLTIEKNLYLRKLLCEFINGDKTFSTNIIQLSRLPGFYRNVNGEYKEQILEHYSDSVYSFEYFVEKLSQKVTIKEPRIKQQKVEAIKKETESESIGNRSVLNWLSIPNKECLNHGVNSNATMAMVALSCDLVGVHNYFVENGITPIENLEELKSIFFDCAENKYPKEPGWKKNQLESIWENAINKNPEPANTSIHKALYGTKKKEEQEENKYNSWLPDCLHGVEVTIKESEILPKKYRQTNKTFFPKELEAFAFWGFLIKSVTKEHNLTLEHPYGSFIKYCKNQNIDEKSINAFIEKAEESNLDTKWTDTIKQNIGKFLTENNENYAKAVNEFNQAYFEKQKKLKKQISEGMKTFSHDELVNTEYLENNLIKENTVIGIKGGLGTGKTHMITDYLTQPENRYKTVICLHSRNSLAYSLVDRINEIFAKKYPDIVEEYKKRQQYHNYISHIEDVEIELGCGGHEGMKIALCTNSLIKLDPSIFEDAIVVIDEVESVNKHTLNANCVDRREEVLVRLGKLLKAAKTVICLDANLTNKTMDYIQKSAEKPQHKIFHPKKLKKAKVNFQEYSINEKGEISTTDKSPYLTKIINLLKDEKNIFVSSDSRNFLESLETHLIKKSILTENQILRVDSKTSHLEVVESFKSNPDKTIEKYKYRLVMISPTVESGVDVSIKNYFSHHFGVYVGQLDADSILQMKARTRDANIQYEIFVRPGNCNRSNKLQNCFSVQDIAKTQQNDLKRTLASAYVNQESFDEIFKDAKEKLTESERQLHNEHSVWLQFKEQIQKEYLAEIVREELEKEGHEVTLVTNISDQETRQNLKFASEEVKRKACEEIYDAKIISIKEAEKPSKDRELPSKIASKTLTLLIKKILPEIDHSNSWKNNPIDFIYQYKYNNLGQKNTRWVLLNNLEIAQKKVREDWEYATKKTYQNCGFLMLNDIKTELSLLEDLKFIGLLEAIPELCEPFHSETPIVKEIIQKIHNLRKKNPNTQIKAQKGFNLRTIRELLNKIGIKLIKSQKMYLDVNDDSKRRQVWVTMIDPYYFNSDERRDCIEAISKRLGIIEKTEKPSEFEEQGQLKLVPNLEKVINKTLGEDVVIESTKESIKIKNIPQLEIDKDKYTKLKPIEQWLTINGLQINKLRKDGELNEINLSLASTVLVNSQWGKVKQYELPRIILDSHWELNPTLELDKFKETEKEELKRLKDLTRLEDTENQTNSLIDKNFTLCFQ